MQRLLTLSLIALLISACSSNPEDSQKAAAVEDRTGTQATTQGLGNTGSQSNALNNNGLSGNQLPNQLPNGNLGQTTPIVPANSGNNANTTRGTGPNGLSADLRNPANLLSKRTVYYDYDSFLVRDEFKAIVEAHARYLLANPAARLRIEGNTDERGSREYNLALGQKRSDSVKRMMVLMGVPEARIDSVSFGEERPKVEGGTEGAYAQNRRSDIAYVGE